MFFFLETHGAGAIYSYFRGLPHRLHCTKIAHALGEKKITWVIRILIYLTSTFHSLIVLYSRKIVYLIMSLWLPQGVRKLSKWTLLWNCHHVSGFRKSHKFAIERNSRLSISFRSQRSPWRSELSTFQFVRHFTSIWGPISYIYIKDPVLECIKCWLALIYLQVFHSHADFVEYRDVSSLHCCQFYT